MFDTLIVFLKELFEDFFLEKMSEEDNRSMKYYQFLMSQLICSLFLSKGMMWVIERNITNTYNSSLWLRH